MKAIAKLTFLFAISAFIIGSAPASATDSVELKAAFARMCKPKLDTTSTRDVSALALQHQNLTITLDSGRIAFFEPVMIDDQQTVYGAFYDGPGRFRFAPPVDMEREQLQRFFNADSLDRSFKRIMLFFSPSIHEQIVAACPMSQDSFSEKEFKQAKDMTDFVTKDEDVTAILWALRGAVVPSQHPYLFAYTDLDKGGKVYYVFDPHEREEVKLGKEYRRIASSAMELVCKYSQYIDETYTNINGLCKECIEIYRYNIEASITSGADFDAVADVTFEVKTGPTQLLPMTLYYELRVDSILDSAGAQVAFHRWEDDDHKSPGMWLFLDRPLMSGEIVTLRFFYNGDAVRREGGEFFVDAGGAWYPRYGFAQRALFTLKFETDKHFTFAATGNKVAEEIDDNTLITTWKVAPPASNVTFTIGNQKKFTFEDEGVVPVDVYFSEKLHNNWAEAFTEEAIKVGKNMQKQVAEDIQNSLRLFSHYFGDYQYPRMSAGEVLDFRSEAFPAHADLRVTTWVNTDSYGVDRNLRAHEVAHQWWGVGVGFETYHDTWLSEGFSEYSALLYLQAMEGNDRFLEWLRDYRNDIFTSHKYLFSSTDESGPIALGYRTRSTETGNDYGLIVYKKGAFVLHMLRNMMIDLTTMNEDTFYNMMKEYYRTYFGARVKTSDFKRLVEKYTEMDMTWFFNQWVYRSDVPTCKFTYDIESDGQGGYQARGKIVTTGVPEDFLMYMPLEIEINDDNKAYVRLLVDNLDYEFTLPGLPSRPKKLRLNPFESVLAKIDQ